METATKSAQYGAPAEEEDYRFRITVSKFETFEAGSQVWIPYGKYSNRQLLTNYGFVLNENIYNYARLKVLLKDFLTEIQIARLPKGFNPEMEIIFKLKAHEFCIELMKVIRTFNWDVNRHSSNAFFHAADYDLELCCLEKYISMLGEVYGRFRTSLEQDMEILTKVEGKLYFAVREN